MNDNIKATAKKVKGEVALGLTCVTCGKPLTVPTCHGIFCEDRHGEKEALAEMQQLKDLMKGFETTLNGRRD